MTGEGFWDVTVVFKRTVLHLASRSEPTIVWERYSGTFYPVDRVEADWIDTIGHIEWWRARAVTWRWIPPPTGGTLHDQTLHCRAAPESWQLNGERKVPA